MADDAAEGVEYTRAVDFHGERYEVTVVVGDVPSALVVEVESSKGERWAGSFSASYIEGLTSKTGNYKRLGTFARMVVGALEGSADSVYIDLLTSADLRKLKKKAEPAVDVPSSRRYLIVTYAVEFDRVHYPLPLDSEAPTVASLTRQLRRLKDKRTAELDQARRAQAAADAELKRLRAENERLKLRLKDVVRAPRRSRSPSVSARRNQQPPTRQSRDHHRPLSPAEPRKRFDPTAYQRERARRLAEAAARRRACSWGSPARLEDGYCSAASNDSRRSGASIDSRRSTTSRRSTVSRAPTTRSTASHVSKSRAPTARHNSNAVRRRPMTTAKGKENNIIDSPRSHRATKKSTAKPASFFDRVVSPPDSPARHTTKHDFGDDDDDDDEESLVSRRAPAPASATTKASTPTDTRKEDDVGDIDRRLNALQAFLREAKANKYT